MDGRLSAWYGDDGIHIATGDSSRYLRSAQVIGWADAAERIEELLDGGEMCIRDRESPVLQGFFHAGLQVAASFYPQAQKRPLSAENLSLIHI